MTVLSSHLTNPQINKCFGDLVNSNHERCCISLIQALHSVDVCPSDPQPSPDLDQLLSCQTMTLDENILTIQSQPTQITDTQAVAFDNLDPLTDSTTYQSHPHTSTDTQIASPSFSPTSSPQTMQPPPCPRQYQHTKRNLFRH